MKVVSFLFCNSPGFGARMLLATCLGLFGAGGAQGQNIPIPFPRPALELSHSSLILTADRPEAIVIAKLGHSGKVPTPIPEITWEVEQRDIVAIDKVSADGSEVRVIALSPTGSSMIYARSGDAVAALSVAIAELQPGVEALDLEDVVAVQTVANVDTTGQPPQPWQIADLRPTGRTRQLEIGDTVTMVSTTAQIPGIQLRIERIGPAIGTADATLRIEGPFVAMTDVYRELSWEIRGVTGSSPAPSSQAKGPVEPTPFECQVEAGPRVDLEVSGVRITFPAKMISPLFAVKIASGSLQSMTLGAEADLSVSLAGFEMTATAEGAFEFDCTLELWEVNVPPIPLGTTGLGLTIDPELGLQGEVALELASVRAALGALEFSFWIRGGLRYDAATGWSTFEEHGELTLPRFNLFEYEPDPGIELSASLAPYLRLKFGLGPAVGGWVLGVNLLQLQINENVQLGIPLAAVTNPPLPPQTGYESPTWEHKTISEYRLMLELGGDMGEALVWMLRSIDPNIRKLGISSEVLYTHELLWGESPDLVLESSHAAAHLGTPIRLGVTARPFNSNHVAVLAGVPVEIWASKDLGAAELIGRSTLNSVGDAEILWQPAASGRYELLAQVEDRVTGWLNLPPITTAILVDISEGPTYGLTPQPLRLGAPFSASATGRVELSNLETALPLTFAVENLAGLDAFTPMSGTLQVGASTPLELTLTCPDNLSVTTEPTLLQVPVDFSGHQGLVLVERRCGCDPATDPTCCPDCCVEAECTGQSRPGGSWGDPHLTTFDGVPYDFQAKGEFILTRSTEPGDSFQIQVRQERMNSQQVAVNTAAAMMVEGDRVALYLQMPAGTMAVKINGVTTPLSDGQSLVLPTGGKIRRAGPRYYVDWPAPMTYRLVLTQQSRNLDLRVLVPQAAGGHLTGLLGNFDGERGNDFANRDGSGYFPAPPSFHQLYNCLNGAVCFAYHPTKGWLITTIADSLFTYASGQGPWTYSPANGSTFPTTNLSLADYPAAQVQAAFLYCRDGGITQQPTASACALDVVQCNGDAACMTMALGGSDFPPEVEDLGDLGFFASDWRFDCDSQCLWDDSTLDDYQRHSGDGHSVRFYSSSMGDVAFTTPVARNLGFDASPSAGFSKIGFDLYLGTFGCPCWWRYLRVRLHTTADDYLELKTNYVNNLPKLQWQDVVVPLTGGMDNHQLPWVATTAGNPDLSQIQWVELFFDQVQTNWGAEIALDHIRFE